MPLCDPSRVHGLMVPRAAARLRCVGRACRHAAIQVRRRNRKPPRPRHPAHDTQRGGSAAPVESHVGPHTDPREAVNERTIHSPQGNIIIPRTCVESSADRGVSRSGWPGLARGRAASRPAAPSLALVETALREIDLRTPPPRCRGGELERNWQCRQPQHQARELGGAEPSGPEVSGRLCWPGAGPAASVPPRAPASRPWNGSASFAARCGS